MVETITDPRDEGKCVECGIALSVRDSYEPGAQGGKTCIPCAMDIDIRIDDEEDRWF